MALEVDMAAWARHGIHVWVMAATLACTGSEPGGAPAASPEPEITWGSADGGAPGAEAGAVAEEATAAPEPPAADAPKAQPDAAPAVDTAGAEITAVPAIQVDPASYQFSYVSPLAQPLTQDIEVFNVGTAALVLTAVGLVPGGSADFSLALVPPLPKTLEPWASTKVRVVFEEVEGGTATLRIGSNDPQEPEVDVVLSSHLKAKLVVDLDLDIDGDCVTATCPANAPYPIGCNVVFSGGDERGCVASTPKSPEVYFQEGNKCGSGHVSGKLTCSDQEGAPLGAGNCPINKAQTFYPASKSGCPAT